MLSCSLGLIQSGICHIQPLFSTSIQYLLELAGSTSVQNISPLFCFYWGYTFQVVFLSLSKLCSFVNLVDFWLEHVISVQNHAIFFAWWPEYAISSHFYTSVQNMLFCPLLIQPLYLFLFMSYLAAFFLLSAKNAFLF